MDHHLAGIQGSRQAQEATKYFEHLFSPIFFGGTQHVASQRCVQAAGSQSQFVQPGPEIRQGPSGRRRCQMGLLAQDLHLRQTGRSHSLQSGLDVSIAKTHRAVTDIHHRLPGRRRHDTCLELFW